MVHCDRALILLGDLSQEHNTTLGSFNDTILKVGQINSRTWSSLKGLERSIYHPEVRQMLTATASQCCEQRFLECLAMIQGNVQSKIRPLTLLISSIFLYPSFCCGWLLILILFGSWHSVVFVQPFCSEKFPDPLCSQMVWTVSLGSSVAQIFKWTFRL